MSFWDSIKSKAQAALNEGATQGHKAKLKADILLLERSVQNRIQSFGIEMYDYVSPLAKNPNFFASDDSLTLTLRPALLTAQREVAALDIKLSKQREAIETAKVQRAAAFAVKATSWQEQVLNAGKSAALGTNEAKLHTERKLIETQINAQKQKFGTTLYQILEQKEDQQGWLPTDREIRSIYDQCRKDVEKIRKNIQAKQQEIDNKSPPPPSSSSSTYNGNSSTYPPASSTAYPSAPVSLPPAAPPLPPPVYGSTTTTASSSYTAPQPSSSAPQTGLFAGIPGAQADPFFVHSSPNNMDQSRDPFGAAQEQDPFAGIIHNNHSQQQQHPPSSNGNHDFLL